MEVAYLSGAYKNAGDFLIEERANALLKYVIPDIKINRYLRSELKENLGEINENDAIVFGGGPLYMSNLDGYLPLNECIEKITTPIMVMGAGWYGLFGGYDLTYQYKFTPLTLKFLQKIDNEGYGLSCRDIYSVRTLNKEGLKNVVMTGCPAWYDLENIHNTDGRIGAWSIKKIMVSDPANHSNYDHAVRVLEYLKHAFPNAEIVFVFHRGMNADNYTSQKEGSNLQELVKRINKMNIQTIDISYGSNGFDIYNDCDLHVGFRVHAHIYNLSIRNRTILIEEDGRGAGVNQALGIPALKAYNDAFQIQNRNFQRVYRRIPNHQYNHLVEDLDSYIKVLQDTDDQYLKNAFLLQEKYFDCMVSYVKKLQIG